MDTKETWEMLDLFKLEKKSSKNPVFYYLKQIFRVVVPDLDDKIEVCNKRKQIRLQCTYLTHSRIISRMGDMFLYKGLSFAECNIEFVKGKIKASKFGMLSPNVVMTIEIDKPEKNKCNLDFVNTITYNI